MKLIIGFIRDYFRDVNKTILIFCTIFISILIWLNYKNHLEASLVHSDGIPYASVTGRWIIYSTAYYIPVLLLIFTKNLSQRKLSWSFGICLMLAPLVFALKAGMDVYWPISTDTHWNRYWNDIIYWPFRGLLVFFMLILLYQLFHRGEKLYGLSAKKLGYKPYLLMLLIMIPLITAASTQADFLASYPKLEKVLPLPDGATPPWLYKLLFELSYGSDFFTIELFFRGFLIIGFTKWLGKDAIIPMACFYCTIHFGKPLGECISSYFGGLLLGIVSYHTRSIYGGLMVHLGIAWLMEIGGFIGNGFSAKF